MLSKQQASFKSSPQAREAEQMLAKKKSAFVAAAPSPSAPWTVHASTGALNTSNPIREIIETMDLAENPEKKVIPLSIGDPTIFGNLKPCKQILDALDKANSCGKYYGYQTAAGMEDAREAVAKYQSKCTGIQVKKQVSSHNYHHDTHSSS